METAQSWRPLGEVIVELGLISQEDLEDALLEQRITHKRLGTILIDKGIVTAQQLTDALVDQIGVEELLDELESENGSGDEDSDDAEGTSRSLGAPFRRMRDRIHIERPTSSRLGKPFSRIGTKATKALGHRRHDAPVAPFAPISALPEVEEPEEQADTAALELVEHEAAEPEPEPRPETATEPETAVESESAPEGPHGWLALARQALDDAEADITRLENFGIARAVELDATRAKLAEEQAAAATATKAHALAEEEISRLHALIDERDKGLTAMEGTVEELREIVGATQGELDTARGELQRVSVQLESARTATTELRARVAELDAAKAEAERRGTRIAELEAQVAELAENLSATDETLGVEMHAREQAQRESKRLHEELADRDARVAKLAQQVEALEAELEVVVAEREQSQRKLRSRERRMTKLETTLADLRTEQEAAWTPTVAEPAEAQEDPEAQAPEPVESDAEAEAAPQPEPTLEPAAAEKTDAGFLYFVPRAGDGYELVEQPGAAPPVGETVKLDGKKFAVTRHSRSPLPFDRRVCVYLRVS